MRTGLTKDLAIWRKFYARAKPELNVIRIPIEVFGELLDAADYLAALANVTDAVIDKARCPK